MAMLSMKRTMEFQYKCVREAYPSLTKGMGLEFGAEEYVHTLVWWRQIR